MWVCKKCGACCKYIKCKYYMNNLCSIYEDRPRICRVSLHDKENNEKLVNAACEAVRSALKHKEKANA